MSTEYTILQIEQAAYYWQNREGPHDGISLGKTASRIAEIYGTMIYEHAGSVAARDVAPDLAGRIDLALKQQELPL
ncbi:DUF3717 domain-containing protein [Eoetvoesiella caeni]